MINHFPTPLPDELFYSLCARYADRVQYPDIEAVNKELFGARGMSSGVGPPSHLGHLVESLPAKHELTVDRLIDQHTLFPFYGPFLSVERYNRVRKDMEGMDGSAIHNCAGITPSNICLPDWFRYCPHCAIKDKKMYRQAYWHRLHQIPGVEVCPRHNIFLSNSSVRARNRVNTSLYVSAERAGLNTAARSLLPQSLDHQVLLQIARDATWLLSQTNLACNSRPLRDRYLTLLAENGLLIEGNKVSAKDLLRHFRNKFSNNLLEIVQCEFDENKRHNWPSLIIPHILHKKTDPPIRHLLLIQLLGNSTQTFFCRPINIKLPDKRKYITCPDKLRPFGEGPWPCLNPVCKQFGELAVKECSIKYKNRRGEEPAATFICTCGFTYRRKGPDKSQEDRYRHDWVLSYGPVWESNLRQLWSDSSISLRQIALKLKMKWDTVKAHAVRLNLKFPRQGPNQKVFKGNSHLSKRPKKRNFTRSKKYHLKVRSFYRKEWLSTRKKHPNARRKQLSQELVPRIHSWLYKHDGEWLQSHSPPPFKRLGSARQIDWNSRDIQLAIKVRESARRLRGTGGFPIRITKGAIARDVDEKTSLIYKKSLTKLPLTSQALEESVESRVAFAIRRIQWAADQFRQESTIPALSTLGFRAAINHSIWYVPEVKAAFEAAISSLRQSTPMKVTAAA